MWNGMSYIIKKLRIIKKFLPDNTVAGLKLIFSNKKIPPLYNGIYNSFEEAQRLNPSNWDNLFMRRRNDYIAAIESERTSLDSKFPLIRLQDIYLPIIASLFDGDVSIVDFGGGIGLSYARTKRCARQNGRNIHYHIIEVPESIKLLKEYWGNEIDLHTEIGSVDRADIVNCASVIHYFNDWRQPLSSLSKCSPEYFIITNTSAYDGPAFVRTQAHLEGHVLPLWVLNIDELVAHMASLGYKLVFCSRSDFTHDVSNYPPERQVGWMSNFIFKRDMP